MKSWKTTALGLAGIITALGNALTAFLDNDPLTVPDLGLVINAVTLGLGLIFARDNKVTSKELGL